VGFTLHLVSVWMDGVDKEGDPGGQEPERAPCTRTALAASPRRYIQQLEEMQSALQDE